MIGITNLKHAYLFKMISIVNPFNVAATFSFDANVFFSDDYQHQLEFLGACSLSLTSLATH